MINVLVKMNYLEVYGKDFLIYPYHFQPEKEENFEETLDNVGYVLINNDPIREGNELDFATISKRCRCNKCL